MKKHIYYGNIAAHETTIPVVRPLSEVSGSEITFTGFDLTGLGTATNKLDLLFYNRVNEVGEVLSSLVYISNVLDLDDTTNKTYNVRKLYVNTSAEITMTITSDMTDFTYLNCKWATSKFFTSSVSPLSTAQHEDMAENGMTSVKLGGAGTAYDGWYTQMSVAFRAINSGAPSVDAVSTKGLLGLHTFTTVGPQAAVLLETDPVDIDDDLVWSPYYNFITDGTTNPDGSILEGGTSLASLLVTLSEDNQYIKQDLFILPVYLDLYDESVLQYAEYPTYGNPFPELRDKHRVIHNYADGNDFVEAQYILQTTDFFRMTVQV